MTLAELLTAVRSRGNITAEDALAARCAVYAGAGVVYRAMADDIFALNDAAKRQSPEWRALFCEVILDYVVHQRDPQGYVDAATANWLMAAVSKSRVLRANEVDALLEVLEKADETPGSFDAFVLRVLLEKAHASVHAGVGLAALDVERMRRAVFACGAASDIGVTRAEAEALIALNDAVKGANVDPSWRDFFARAVGASLLYQTSWRPDAGAERARQLWLRDPHAKAPIDGRDWSEGFSEGWRELVHDDFSDHDMEIYAEDEAAEAEAEQMTPEKILWLRTLIGGAGALDPAERCLLAFIVREARSLAPEFKAWIADLGVTEAEAPGYGPAEPEAPPRGFGRRGLAPA
jgi:hypothetical protein